MCASQRETVEAPLSERLVHQMNFFALYTRSLYQLIPQYLSLGLRTELHVRKSKLNRNGGNDFQAGTPLLVPHCLSDSVHGSHHHVSMQEYLMHSCPWSVVPCSAAFEHWQHTTSKCLQQIVWGELSRSNPLSRHNSLVHQVTLLVP